MHRQVLPGYELHGSDWRYMILLWRVQYGAGSRP